jgi:hypothetical protein
MRSFTQVSAIKVLEDPVLQRLLNRAEAYLNRIGTYCPDNGSGYSEDMKTAIYLLAEILYYRSLPIQVSRQITGFKSEKIGTYSYTADNGGSSLRFNPLDLSDELRSIIDYYMCTDEPILRTTTIVFREMPPSLVTGNRDYKDISDFDFDFVEDAGIFSGTKASRDIR